jgi:hypothetical protein
LEVAEERDLEAFDLEAISSMNLLISSSVALPSGDLG